MWKRFRNALIAQVKKQHRKNLPNYLEDEVVFLYLTEEEKIIKMRLPNSLSIRYSEKEE